MDGEKQREREREGEKERERGRAGETNRQTDRKREILLDVESEQFIYTIIQIY